MDSRKKEPPRNHVSAEFPTGIAGTSAIHGPVLNRASMLIDAAVDGHDIALARTTLAAWDLINKRLVRPFAVALPLAKSYWIVCPKATAALPKLIAFRDWLLAEAGEDAWQLKALAEPARARRGSNVGQKTRRAS